MTAPHLADAVLGLAADVLDDLEKVRIANENRLRQMTRAEDDEDGEDRGFGYAIDHPDVARLAALVDGLKQAEHQAELNLRRLLRQHPLGPWIQQTKGVGEKRGARLLAAIGDPYIRPQQTRTIDGTEVIEPSRPRTPSELWAYTGYHVINGKAPARTKGQRANWSPAAKMRAHLIAKSVEMVGGPYRDIYDQARKKHDDAVHAHPCAPCGGKSKPPAEVGSPLKDGHKQARALRAVAKAVLLDMWREAKRLHEAELDETELNEAA